MVNVDVDYLAELSIGPFRARLDRHGSLGAGENRPLSRTSTASPDLPFHHQCLAFGTRMRRSRAINGNDQPQTTT